MKKIFVALITVCALAFATVTFAASSATKQKADAVAQVSIEKSAITSEGVLRMSIDTATEISASPVCEVAMVNTQDACTAARPLKPDIKRDYGAGNRLGINSHGHRQTMFVLTQ